MKPFQRGGAVNLETALDAVAGAVYQPGPKGAEQHVPAQPIVTGYPLSWELLQREFTYSDVNPNEQTIFQTSRLHHACDVYITNPVEFSHAQGIVLALYGHTGRTGRTLLQSFCMSRSTPPGQALLALSVRQVCESFEVTMRTFDIPPTSDQLLQLALFAGPLDSAPQHDPTVHRATTFYGLNDPRISVRDLDGFRPYVGNVSPLSLVGFDAFNAHPTDTLYLNIWNSAPLAGPPLPQDLRQCYQFKPGESKEVRIPHSTHADSIYGPMFFNVTPAPLGVGATVQNAILGTVYLQ